MSGKEGQATRSLLIRARRIVRGVPGAGADVLHDGAVLVDDGRVVAVDRAARLAQASAAETLDGAVLLPGFVDLHVHGFGGHAFGGRPYDAAEAARLLAQTGVTTCFAAIGAGGAGSEIQDVVLPAAAAVGVEPGGARVAGIFIEAPYISVEKRGAWSAERLRKPSVAELAALVRFAHGTLKRINIAPELPDALEMIRAARDHGVVVSIGHSNASYEQALAGIEAGATIANHTFNAMSGLDHRSPGMVGAVLTTDLLAELILDGVHVHPAAAKALYRARGPAGITLITDAVAQAGLPDGEYTFAGRAVSVRYGACRLPDGTLAGSVSPFDRNLRLARTILTDDLCELTAVSSTNAARALGLGDVAGVIAPGRPADLVLLDGEFQVLATVVAGKVAYQRASSAGTGDG